MGNFYVNFSVKSTDQGAVVAALQAAKRVAFISPARDGYVVVYERDSDSQDDKVIVDVGRLLSQAAAAPVLAVLNHDDDLLCYWLFENGALISTYISDPGWLDEEEDDPPQPDFEQLCRTLAVPDALNRVEEIVNEEYLFAAELHTELAEALRLPAWSVGAGFTYIERGELPEELEADDLLRVG